MIVESKTSVTHQYPPGDKMVAVSGTGAPFQSADPLRVVGVSMIGPHVMAASASGAVAKMVAINAETAVMSVSRFFIVLGVFSVSRVPPPPFVFRTR